MWKFTAELELWPTSQSPWHYLEIPSDIVGEIMQLPLDRGLKKVNVSIDEYQWQTSILPAGKGRKIIPIKAKVRKDLELDLGNQIDITVASIDI